MAYGFKRTLTIDHTQCGASNSSSFPVLVSFTSAALKSAANGGHVQSGSGYDIGFFSDLGLSTSLYWEMDFYDAVNGIVVAWVNVPTVSSSSDTVIYIAYGDSSISTFQSTASSVWDANFKTVYHLGNGSALGLADSTSNGNTGTNSGASAVAGQISGAASFNGSSNYINGSVSVLNIPLATLSVWVSVQSAPASDALVVGLADGVGSSTFDHVVMIDSTLHPKFYLYDGAQKYTTLPVTALSLNTWTMLTGVITGGNAYIYINGVYGGSCVAGGGFAGFTVPNLIVGGHTATLFTYLATKIDEVQISSVARSVDWLLTSYNNQKTGSTFLTVGSEVVQTVNTISGMSHAFGFFDMGDPRQ